MSTRDESADARATQGSAPIAVVPGSKPDEVALFNALRVSARTNARSPNRQPLEFADAVGATLGIHPKRVEALLWKWTKRGWWNYGTSARGGWFEEEAPDELRSGAGP